MSPRHLIPTALVIALAAGGITAIAITDGNDDNDSRTIAVTGVVREAPAPAPSLDTLVARRQKLSFSLADARPILSGVTTLRGRLERSESGQITGRIEARP